MKPALKMASVKTLCDYATHGLHGKNWYSDAIGQIDYVANRENWCSIEFAGVIATSSPRCSVVRNIRLSLAIMKFGDLKVIPMRGIRTSVRRFLNLGGIKGQKTSAFFRNLTGCAESVTLDVWMAYALGIPQTGFNLIATRGAATDRIRSVGKKLGIPPCEAQASIWTGYRQIRGYSPSPFGVASEYLKAIENNWQIEGIKTHAI